MSGRPDSFMPFYIGDYMADTRHLTLAEHGAYLFLIMHYWRSGPLADDDVLLARVSGMSAIEWRRSGPVLRKFFKPALIDGENVLTHKRIETELTEACKRYKTQAERTEAARAAKQAKKDAILASVTESVTESVTDVVTTPVTSSKPQPQPQSPSENKSSLRSDSSAGAELPLLASEPKSTKLAGENADIRACVEAYNEAGAPLGWVKCEKMTKSRAAKVRQRLKDCGGVAGWRAAMRLASKSPFLSGETGRSKDHENWRPDFEFFLSQEHFVKLLEGGYDGKSAIRTSGDEHPTPEQITRMRRICLRDWAAGKPWPAKNISGNGVWRDQYGIGPPPDDPRTLVTPADLAAVPEAKTKLDQLHK